MSQLFFGYNDFFPYLMPTSSAMLHFLGREVQNWQGLHILDTACGDGALAQELADNGARVTALEADANVVAHAAEVSRRGGNLKRPDFFLGGPDSFPDTTASYHMILCLNNAIAVLQNEAALRAFLNRAATQLEPSGRLVLQLFNYDRILDHHDYTLEDILRPAWGITVRRSLQPDGSGGLTLQSRIEILRPDAMELSTYRTYLWPVRRHQLNNYCKESGFTTVHFYADLEASTWQADSYSTLLVAIR